VGVYDKRSGTLTIHETAASGTVFALQQSVPSYAEAMGRAAKSPALNRVKSLFEDFGSSKKRRLLRSQDANRVNTDIAIGSGSVMLDSFMKGGSMSESNRRAIEEQRELQKQNGEILAPYRLTSAANEDATKQWREGFLPKFNKDTEEPHQVYDACEIAGDLAWGQASRVVDACLQQDDVVAALMRGPPHLSEAPRTKTDVWNGSVQELLSDVVTIPDGEQVVKHRLKCALLVNHFVNLYVTLKGKRFIPTPDEDRPRFFGAPIEYGYRFLERFTESTTAGDGILQHVMTPQKKDKCCSHVLILYVMARGGASMKVNDIKPIADDLKIGVDDAADLLKQAGFEVVRKPKKIISVELKAPVRFPSLPTRNSIGTRAR